MKRRAFSFTLVLSIMEALVLNNGTMSSVEIAELTGKQHKHVMEAIRTMEPAWEKVYGSKFRLVDYTDKKGEKRPCYELNKTECLYIATKFNDEARAKLVLRWEELETKEQQISLSPAEILLRQAQALVNHEREMKRLTNELAEIKQRTTTDLKHSTIVAYVSRNNIQLDVKRYGAIGKKASSLCQKRGIETSKVNDVRWGQVKVYPDEILDEVFAVEKANKGK